MCSQIPWTQLSIYVYRGADGLAEVWQMKRLANLLLLTDCQQARDTMIRALHKVGVCAKDSTSKGVCIDVIYADTLSRFRRSLGLPRFMTTVGYEKWMDGDSSIANLVSTSSSNSKPSIAAKYQNLSLMEIMRNFSRYAQPKPNLPNPRGVMSTL